MGSDPGRAADGMRSGPGRAAGGPGAGSGSVLCLLERDADGVADESLRVLVLARSLASAAGGGVTAVLFGSPDGATASGDAAGGGAAAGDATGGTVAAQAAAVGAGLCLVSAADLTGYAPLAWARALEQLAAADGAVAVLAAATDHGSEVLAHLGALTGLPVAANCVAVTPDGPGQWQLTRQRWAGSLLEDAVLEAPCALLTVAADALPASGSAGPADAGADAGTDADAGAGTHAGDAGKPAAAPAEPAAPPAEPAVAPAEPAAAPAEPSAAPAAPRTFVPELQPADLRVCATESAEQSAGMSLATARVVVGGGRGVGGPEGFAALEELAGLLGGVVGVSRVVTSQGWRPHRQQVGQTGTKISPELYLACGISGAIQHMAGCLSARHIVVVNTDPDAPIIAHAEYAVIGDLSEVIPALVAAIRDAAAGGG